MGGLSAFKPGEVILGEGSSVGYDFPGQVDSLTAMEANGSADVARRLGLPMIDLNHDERVMVRVENALVMPEFGVAKTAYEADVIVGKCPMKLRHAGVYVPGCPPHGIKMADGICEAFGLDKDVVHEAIEVLHSVGD